MYRKTPKTASYWPSLYGEESNDQLYGGLDNDRLKGDSSNDTLYGSDGKDQLNGGNGQDLVVGIIGTTDSVTIQQWFSGAANGLTQHVCAHVARLMA